MTQLHFITNSIAAVTETTYDGKAYLIAPVVMIREGVMNGLLYLSEEFGKYAQNWQGRPVSLGHPQRNGEYVSANSPDVWANEVPGQLWNVTADAKSLKGEIWIDLEKAAKIGDPAMAVVESLRASQPTEVSTGVLIDIEETAGVWTNGATYDGIARNIYSDHLALLPNETGACSWDDGCGTPRVNKKGEGMQINEMTLDDRAMLVRRAFWEQVSMGDTDGMAGDWDVLAVFDDTLVAKDWVSKGHVAFPYTLSESDSAVKFGDSTPVEVVYRAKEGGAEVVIANSKPVSLLARVKQWLAIDKTDSSGSAPMADEVAANVQQEEENVKKCDLVASLATNKAVTVPRETLEGWDEAVLQAFHDSLKANEETAPEAPVTEAPAPAVPEWQQAFAELSAKLDSALSAITANADNEKAGLVADIVANEQCKFSEAQLKAMDIATLQTLADTLQVRDYSGGAGVIRDNSRNDDYVEMPMPKLEWAVGKEAK